MGAWAITLLGGIALAAVFGVGLLAVFRAVLRRTASRRAPLETADPARSFARLGLATRERAYEEAQQLRRKLASAYGRAGVAAAGVAAVGLTLIYVGQVRVASIVALTVYLLWPVLLCWRMAAGVRGGNWRRAVAGYFLAIGLMSVFLVVRNAELRLLSLVVLWVAVNGLPTGLLWLFLNRRLALLGPTLLLLGLILAGISWRFALAVAEHDDLRSTMAFLLSGLGVDWRLTLPAVIGMGVLLAIPLLPLALRGMAGGWERRWWSEQSLALDTIWFLFLAVAVIVGLSTNDASAPRGAGMVAGAQVVWMGLSRLWLAKHDEPAEQPRLLVLRVFAQDEKALPLFDAVTSLWRMLGPVAFVAAGDLASRIVQPATVWRFLSGRLQDGFVSDVNKLEAQFAAASRTVADRDGRYRLTELFCYENTWESTVSLLAARSDAVLMDLRGVERSKGGVLREVGLVLAAVPASRVVLVLEQDSAVVRQAESEAWAGVPAGSPNANRAPHALRRVVLRNESEAAREEVCRAVLGCLGSEPEQASEAGCGMGAGR